jgi:uncharacterized protein with PIN domain
MMVEDQEQMITFTQLEDRALEVGGKLQRLLLEERLSQGARAVQVGTEVRCPKCQKVVGESNKQVEERRVEGRAGPVLFRRGQYHCPSCRKVFSPSGREVAVGGRGLESGADAQGG